MRDSKSRKGSADFIVGVSVHSVKYFSENKSSDYEIGPIDIDGLAYDEATTIHGFNVTFMAVPMALGQVFC
jgi:hypothetical protein